MLFSRRGRSLNQARAWQRERRAEHGTDKGVEGDQFLKHLGGTGRNLSSKIYQELEWPYYKKLVLI